MTPFGNSFDAVAHDENGKRGNRLMLISGAPGGVRTPDP